MNDHLLQPDAPLRKIIALTRTERWASVLRHYSARHERIAALDLSDLKREAYRWPGSVAVIEVDDVNLVSVCRFSLNWRRLRRTCPLFAVTGMDHLSVASALSAAGFYGTFRNPLNAPTLVRQIVRFQHLFNEEMPKIEDKFRQRLPWKPLDRYPDNPFRSTTFSTPSEISQSPFQQPGNL